MIIKKGLRNSDVIITQGEMVKVNLKLKDIKLRIEHDNAAIKLLNGYKLGLYSRSLYPAIIEIPGIELYLEFWKLYDKIIDDVIISPDYRVYYGNFKKLQRLSWIWF